MWEPGVQSGSRVPSGWARARDTTPSATSSFAETVRVAVLLGVDRPASTPDQACATALVPTTLQPPVIGLPAGCVTTTDGRDGILNQ
ncbi:hypothetical protein GCM10022232_17990 [Streptomyces plumbiresistens]|uniref:Uncharacterized protein n=1 Tax=Streptomyces plumbiresistens TaxID=511811 RepID=A0ABP7QQ39_9ACTN